jgi:hypothetical protein
MGYFITLYITIGLYVAPIIAIFIFWLSKKKNKITKWILIISSILIGIIGLMTLFRFKFDTDYPYYILFILFYFVYCFLVYCSLRLKRKVLRISLFIFGLLPILGIYIFSIINIAIFAFMCWFIPDIALEKKINNDLYIRLEKSGNVSTTWWTVNISKKYLFLPYVHKDVVSKSINNDTYTKDSFKVDIKDSSSNYAIKIRGNDDLIIDTLIKK